MPINVAPNNMTIADFAEQVRNRQIIVNPTYQRTERVWPVSAKSNLIDTILNGFPVPKLIISQSTDLDTRLTRKEIVDGQQRTAAIIQFMNNDYSLTRGQFAGLRFDDLDEDLKHKFLGYQLSADVFTSASPEEIREVFRRINSYQVPLNAQETRHATHQGEFKWFIKELADEYSSAFVAMGTLTERQISRMADLELLTELVQVTMTGIKTGTPSALNKLYDQYDREFPQKDDVRSQIQFGLGAIIDLNEVHNTPLTSRGNVYPFFAAHVATDFPASPIRQALPEDATYEFADRASRISNLGVLADAIESGTEQPPLNEFYLASRQGTNTLINRTTRLRWFHRALTQAQL